MDWKKENGNKCSIAELTERAGLLYETEIDELLERMKKTLRRELAQAGYTESWIEKVVARGPSGWFAAKTVSKMRERK